MNTTAPQIVLGTMGFGTHVAPEQAFAILDAFVAGGGVWLDTANCYSFWADPSGVGGASERVIGAWLRARPGARDAVRIATKVRQNPLVAHSWPKSAEGLSADAVRAGAEESLGRLGVDHVDMLWAHAEDRGVPLEETVGAFGELVSKGTALRVGAANHAAWRVERARSLAREQGVEPWTALQLRHSLTPLGEAGHRLHDHGPHPHPARRAPRAGPGRVPARAPCRAGAAGDGAAPGHGGPRREDRLLQLSAKGLRPAQGPACHPRDPAAKPL
ncbi:aldo/keto reductase [Streptomyces sp. NPDC088727]|uniref:aldo/keto reductase n=1 Tax=Streptomyces sp. NPDC088727 TaxID=3365875 RepID=UPI00380ECFAE